MNQLKNLLAPSALLFASTCFAQWNPGSADHAANIFRSGNVALGTASAVPEVKLFVSSTTTSGGDNTMRLEAPNIGTIPSHIHWGTTGDWYIRSATTNGKVIIQDTGGGIGLGSVGTLRGKLDVSVQGDMYFSLDANSGSTQSIYLPGHIFIAPYQGGNISYLQARRQNNSGTTALQIRTYNSGTLTEALRIEGNGNVGIGTTIPRGKFDIDGPGDIYLSDDIDNGTAQRLYLPGDIHVSPWSGSDISYVHARRSTGSGTVALRFRTSYNGNTVEPMHIEGNGNIGIGTLNPDQKLTVKGIIHSEEVRVDMTVPGPDYVFEKDYDLLPLSELENYITQNKHLPEVPSAKQMEAEGLNLKEMNLLLLKKVEELTLHLIEQNKNDLTQKEQIKLLRIEVEKLKCKN
jgi:hypothetical protein